MIFTTLAFITVCFRLFTRAVLVKNVGSDDYYIVGSMVSLLSLCHPLGFVVGGPMGVVVGAWEETEMDRAALTPYALRRLPRLGVSGDVCHHDLRLARTWNNGR